METPLIKTTTDYDKFNFIVGNRNLNKNKIERIITDIKNGLNLLPYCPILVFPDNGQYRVIDGQHRLEVSKLIESPVYFIETTEIQLRQIAAINSRQDKWSQRDFLKCWIKIGIKDYQVLEDVMREFSIGLSTASTLLMRYNMTSRPEVSPKFRDGLFKVNHLQEVKILLALSHSLFDVYKFYKDRNLIDAVREIVSKGLCDFKILKEKLKQAPMIMDKQSSSKEYIYNIERVYNYKNSQRKVIF